MKKYLSLMIVSVMIFTSFINSSEYKNNSGIIQSYNGFLNPVIEYDPDKFILIFTDKSDKNILTNLTIGMTTDEVKNLLGTPELEYDGAMLYYIEEYSVMFFGEDKVKYFAVAVNPQLTFDYDDFISDINKTELDLREIRNKYGGDMVYTDGGIEILLIDNGVVIYETRGKAIITLYHNPYVDWKEYTIDNSKVIDKDYDFDSFIKFCEIMESNDWIYNNNDSLAFHVMDNYHYNTNKIVIRDEKNNMRVVDTIYTPDRIEWVSEYELMFFTHTSLYGEYEEGPFIYNYKDDNLDLIMN